MADTFDLAPIPRRPSHFEPDEKPGAQTFRIEAPGEPPTVIKLPTRLAAVLTQIAQAMPEGLPGGDPRLAASVSELRASGVAIQTSRTPRTDGGQGHIAVYRLQGEVSHG